MSALETAQSSWGDELPEWVRVMAIECDQKSQSQVAREMKRSASLVNMVLKNRYGGRLTAVKELVDGLYLNGTVTCPALGRLPTNECQQHRRAARSFNAVNAYRVRMFRACSRCPLNKREGA